MARAVEQIEADTSWTGRPRRPVQIKLRDKAVQLYQLNYHTHQKLPVELPFGPCPSPQDWTLARCLAETAADAAIHLPVGKAWAQWAHAWGVFASALELELE
eukprot:7415106-Pyramimonas_sp.AAC.1